MSLYTELIVSEILPKENGIKVFVLNHTGNLKYRAGQYLTLVRRMPNGEVRRSYSIFSSPELGEPLSIAVKRLDNGIFSRYLMDEIHEGDILLSTGTGGVFTLPDDISHYKQIFLFAAGTGITPIFSLIKSLLYRNPGVKVILVYSNRSVQSSLFLKELQDLEDKFPDKFILELLYSNSQNLYRARLHQDLLKELVKKHTVGSLDLSLCFICGPVNYMRMCTYNMVQLGVPLHQIRKEIFVMPPSLPKSDPPDTSPYNVTIKFKESKQTFKVQYPDPIHKTARIQGMDLPYSCETGRCGNCIALCTKGEVYMSYNEVLTDRDVKQGLVLTCVGYPVGGDVELEIK
ncbi:ferredoxin--NADP reductase [Anditalea andensis]|uniref:Oxidoreductase n=1 Tax=Anditalea andensis TaxID=1048983 RepID=A0A074L2T2_9BACT|nr:ferredoxin--NADP reductase [Anditalea andensis]KEO74148.1 oxidoreductase [Anditalea andensis]